MTMIPGLGVSAGVKGARVGAGPRGPAVAGGKDGIYFRENLSTKNPRRDGWDLRPLFYLGLIIVAIIVAFLASKSLSHIVGSIPIPFQSFETRAKIRVSSLLAIN
jgi:hypothetical protein